jgi:uncharacterized protein (TIGR03000 family)
MTLKKSLLAAVVAVAAVTMSANTSFGWFGHHRGSCGSWGGGSWGGSWGGSRGSWGGSWGGGSGGSWGGYSSSCGSYGGYSVSYSNSCGSYGGGYGYSGVVYDGYASSRPVTRVYVAKATPEVKTRLTLHVPADAKVTLAGVETKQTGEVRQFATGRLAKGQNWNDYKVVVETTRNGQTLREERTLNLTGGQDQDLTVAFADSDSTQQIAQR